MQVLETVRLRCGSGRVQTQMMASYLTVQSAFACTLSHLATSASALPIALASCMHEWHDFEAQR